MPERVVFYIDIANPSVFLRRLLWRKICLPRQRALIYAPDKVVRDLNDSLWMEGFVPHLPLAEDDGETPVLLTATPPPADFSVPILISLHEQIPSFVESFSIYVDIIPPGGKAAGRERYRYFKERGRKPEVR